MSITVDDVRVTKKPMGRKKKAKVEKQDNLILENRDVITWKCKHCNHIQEDNAFCVNCNSQSGEFEKIVAVIPMNNLISYECLVNIMLNAKHLMKGATIKLSDKDPRGADMVKRGLVRKIK